MSLDSLFKHILVTEQQLTEQTHRLNQVKVDIIKCNEKIKATREKFEEANVELDEKGRQLCVVRLQHKLLQSSEEQMLSRLGALRSSSQRLQEQLESTQQQAAEEQDRFLEEVSRFNSEMSLQANPEHQTQNQRLIQEMLREEEKLKQEMEQMMQSSRHVTSVREERRRLLLELHSLDSSCTDLEERLREAEERTLVLKAQRAAASQKPLTDPTCVRMRAELELYKEGEMELLRGALSSEMLFLQNKLHDVQGAELKDKTEHLLF